MEFAKILRVKFLEICNIISQLYRTTLGQVREKEYGTMFIIKFDTLPKNFADLRGLHVYVRGLHVYSL